MAMWAMEPSAFEPSFVSHSASHALAAAIGLPCAPSAVARGKQPMVGDVHPTTYPVYDPDSPFTSHVARPDNRLKTRLQGVGGDFLISPELRRAGGSMSSLHSVYADGAASGEDWSVKPLPPPPPALSLTYQHANASSFAGGPNRRRTASSTGYAPYAGERKRSASGVISPPPSASRNRNPKSLRVVTMPAPPRLVHTLSTDSNGSMPLTPVSNTHGSVSPMFDDWANLPSLSEPKVPWQSPASVRTLSTEGLGVTFNAAPTLEPSMPFSFADLYNIGLGQGGLDDEDAFCSAAGSDLMPSPLLESDGLIGVERTEAVDVVGELTFAHGLPTPLLTAHSTMSSPCSSSASQCVSPSTLNPALISPDPSMQSPPSHHPPPALFDPLTQMNGLAFLTDAQWDPPIVPLVRRQLGGGVVRGLSGQHATGSFANVGPGYLDELDDDTTLIAPVSPPVSPPAVRERSTRPRKRARSETIDEQDEDAEGERDDGSSAYGGHSDEPSDDEYRPDFGSPPGRRSGGGRGDGFHFDGHADDFIVDTSAHHSSKRQRTVSGPVIRRLRPGPKPRTERGQARADAAAASLPPPTSPQQAFVSALSTIGAPLDERVLEEVAVANELEAYGGPTVSLSKDAIRSLYADLPHDHKSKNRFACLIEGCGRTFPRKSAIESHIQTHLEDKPFVCPHPGWSRHSRIHSNVKPHQCPCGKGFARGDALTRHRQRGICVGSTVPRRC